MYIFLALATYLSRQYCFILEYLCILESYYLLPTWFVVETASVNTTPKEKQLKDEREGENDESLWPRLFNVTTTNSLEPKKVTPGPFTGHYMQLKILIKRVFFMFITIFL